MPKTLSTSNHLKYNKGILYFVPINLNYVQILFLNEIKMKLVACLKMELKIEAY